MRLIYYCSIYCLAGASFKQTFNNQNMRYTIISGTDRPGSNTKKVANNYLRLLQEKGVDVQLLSLETEAVFAKDGQFTELAQTYLYPTDKYIIVMPEYNGSFPGVLKLLIDKSDVKTAWWNKKALLTGVATGRAGNLRGMEHLTGSLMHLKMMVHHNRLPISMVDKILDAEGNITDEGTLKAIGQQLDEFIGF